MEPAARNAAQRNEGSWAGDLFGGEKGQRHSAPIYKSVHLSEKNVVGTGIFFFGLFFSTLGLHPATACLAYKPISKSDYLNALIVRADVVEYFAYSNKTTAIVTLNVKEILQGSATLNCTPFRPDSRHKQKGSSTGLRTGLCLTSIDMLNC